MSANNGQGNNFEYRQAGVLVVGRRDHGAIELAEAATTSSDRPDLDQLRYVQACADLVPGG